MSRDTIRILHTADWHLGREFHGKDMTGSHGQFFEWLLQQVEERDIDLVIMAGDIYDRALPPLTAIQLFNREVDRLTGKVPLVLISGNHDSTVRMSHGQLLREGLHLRSGTDKVGEPVVFENFAFPLAVYPVPYLDPITAGSELQVGQTHEEVLGRAVEAARVDLEERGADTRSVLVAHAFVTGSETSESERGIMVGGAEDVPASLFEGFDYTALGHLHRPQAPAATVRYSGSPLCLSFSESGDEKSVAVVELTADGSTSIEEVAVPRPVEISRLEGTLDQLMGDPGFRKYADHWVEITLTDKTQPLAPMERLGTVFENVLSLRFSELGPENVLSEARQLEELSKTDPLELLKQFVTDVRGEGPSDDEVKILEQALDHKTGSETRG